MQKYFITLVIIFFTTAVYAGDFSVSVKTVGGTFSSKNIYKGFGCSGENISPEVTWENPPEGTKSFVVTMYDQDAPTGSGWWHWVVTDVRADTRKLEEGFGGVADKSDAVNMRTDYGTHAYGGPCPPPGMPHRYIFSVYAMKVKKLGVPKDASAALVGFMTRANAIASAETVVKFGR